MYNSIRKVLLPEPILLLNVETYKFLKESLYFVFHIPGLLNTPYYINTNIKYNFYVMYKLKFVELRSEMYFRATNDIYRLHISSNITIWPYVVFMPK